MRPRGVDSALTWVAYGVLDRSCAERLVGLGRSLWLDEIITVEAFVREGPRVILAGPYLKNNHELFSMLAWLTSSAAGESEIALRLSSSRRSSRALFSSRHGCMCASAGLPASSFSSSRPGRRCYSTSLRRPAATALHFSR